MALQITESCVNCWACFDVCPNDAIAAICPIEMAIVDELGAFLNPPGSLTGIPIEKLKQFGMWKDAA